MAEYIKREALKNDIAKSTEPFNTGFVFRVINRQIAADVAPNRSAGTPAGRDVRTGPNHHGGAEKAEHADLEIHNGA